MNHPMDLEEMETSIVGYPTTLVAKMNYSENASSKGSIHWLEQEKTVPFGSFTEFVHLIEDAIKTSKRRMVSFRSW